jgi:hypothetical protein
MTEPTKPDDFVFEEIPLGPAQAQVHSARTRATQLTKAAIQAYLQQYFDDSGQYRDQIRAIAPQVVQYETGITGTARQDDSSVYTLQLARFWPNLQQKLPCFIIVDTSFQMNSTGLGGSVMGHDFGAYQGVSIRMDATVGITIEIAANDETTAADLRDVLSLVLGPLTTVNRAHVQRPADPTASWEVRLPLRFETQGLERRQIPSDQLDSFWSTTIILDVDFEGVAVLKSDNPDNILKNDVSTEVNYDPFYDNAEDIEPSVSLNISVPSVVYLGHQAQIHAAYVPYRSMFLSDNPNVLLVQDETLIPRRLGTCNILLVNSLGTLLESYPITVEPA